MWSLRSESKIIWSSVVENGQIKLCIQHGSRFDTTNGVLSLLILFQDLLVGFVWIGPIALLGVFPIFCAKMEALVVLILPSYGQQIITIKLINNITVLILSLFRFFWLLFLGRLSRLIELRIKNSLSFFLRDSLLFVILLFIWTFIALGVTLFSLFYHFKFASLFSLGSSYRTCS